jgi:molybdate transport system substrate-binding protein
MVDPAAPDAADGRAVRILAAGAVKAVVLELAESFQAQTGWRLDLTFDTVGALADRVLRGEPADAILLSTPVLEMLASKGFGRHACLRLGTTGVALAGRRGLDAPDMSCSEQFQSVLLSAESIGYADPARGATAGRHFVAVLDQLGLAQTLRSRLRMFPFGVEAVEALARGEVDLAVSQATEIITHPGVSFVGLFPPPYDLSTGYGATLLSDHDGGRRFLLKLQERVAAASLRRAGFF